MGLFWRIGMVVTAGSIAFALGLSLIFSIVLSLAALLILIRREILESLFPLRAYRKNCLSVRGLERDPKFEEQFRNELAAAICQVFPDHKPTACCCIGGGKEICEATLVLHSPEGHLQIRVFVDSISGATNRLLGRVQHYTWRTALQDAQRRSSPKMSGMHHQKSPPFDKPQLSPPKPTRSAFEVGLFRGKTSNANPLEIKIFPLLLTGDSRGMLMVR